VLIGFSFDPRRGKCPHIRITSENLRWEVHRRGFSGTAHPADQK
jgi:hypothetical protein